MLCAPVHLGQLPLSSPITNSSTRSGLLSPGMGQVQGFGSGKELKKSQGPCHCQFIGRHPQRTDSSASGPKGDRSTHPRAEPQLHPKCPVHGIPNSHVPLVHEGLSPGSESPQMRNGAGEVRWEEKPCYLPASTHSSSGFSHGSGLWLCSLSSQLLWRGRGQRGEPFLCLMLTQPWVGVVAKV